MTTTQSAIQAHGAKRVSDAAYAAMNGQRAALEAVGLGEVRGLGPLHAITVECFAAMSSAERAADLTDAAISAAKLP